jgi:hypothetical protein
VLLGSFLVRGARAECLTPCVAAMYVGSVCTQLDVWHAADVQQPSTVADAFYHLIFAAFDGLWEGCQERVRCTMRIYRLSMGFHMS